MIDVDNEDLRKKMLQIFYDKNFGPRPRTLPMKVLSEKLDVDIKIIRANIDYLNSKKLIYQPDEIGLIPRIKGYYWITSEGIDLIEKNNKTDKKKTEALESIFPFRDRGILRYKSFLSFFSISLQKRLIAANRILLPLC